MTTTLSFVALVTGCAAVTMLPRLLPFLASRRLRFSSRLLRWLGYVPVCLFAALVTQTMLREGQGLPSLELMTVLGVGVSAAVAALSKNMLLTVLCGIVVTALLRMAVG